MAVRPGIITTTTVQTSQAPGSGDRVLLLVGKSPSAVSGVGVPVLIKSITQAQTEFGTSTNYGNILPAMIEQAFASSSTGPSASQVLAVSVGANISSGTSSTVSNVGGILAGTVSVPLVSATGIIANDYVAIDTGAKQEIVKVASVLSNTLTLADKISMKHDNGVSVVKLTMIADSVYDTALTNCLTTQFGQIECVVADTSTPTVLGHVKDHVVEASENYELERYALTAGPMGANTTAEFTDIATLLNSDRYIVVGGSLKDSGGNIVNPAITATAVAQHIVSESNISKPLRTIQIQGFSGVLKTWSSSQLNDLYVGGVCPLIFDPLRAVPVLYEDITSTTGTLNVLKYIPQRRVADYVEKNLKSVIEPIFGRENNSKETRNSLKKFIEQILKGYADIQLIPTGLQEYKGAVRDTTPQVTVAPNQTEPTQVDVQVSYYVYYEMRTIDIQISLIN